LTVLWLSDDPDRLPTAVGGEDEAGPDDVLDEVTAGRDAGAPRREMVAGLAVSTRARARSGVRSELRLSTGVRSRRVAEVEMSKLRSM
jgi:hypothetical protein